MQIYALNMNVSSIFLNKEICQRNNCTVTEYFKHFLTMSNPHSEQISRTMEHSSFTCCSFIFIIIYIYIFFGRGGGGGELCHSTPVLLYKYLQYVYFDPSVTRFDNLPVKCVTHFYNVCLLLRFYSFCFYFTCFLVYILSFYLICCLML